MMATMISPTTLPSTDYLDSVPPTSLLIYPTLIDQTSLADLQQLVRNRNYHLYHDVVTRMQLDQLILANALMTRLASLLYYAQTLLVRLVVNQSPANDNTSDFTVLTQAAHELQKSITTKYTSPIEESVRPSSSHGSAHSGPSSRSFLDELSPTASATLLKFLSSVRNDPSLISSRLLQATDNQLDSLVSWKPYHHVTRLKDASATRQNNVSIPAIDPADYIVSFHRHDPIFILTSIIFGAPHDLQSPEYHRRLNTWSSCLAQLIDAKRGNRVIFAVLDIWMGNEWQMSSSFETVILGFLQDAAKVRNGKGNYDVSCDDEDATDPEMVEILNKTLLDVLRILNGFGGVPAAALELVHAIYGRSIDKESARMMLFTKWFIRHHVGRIIQFPEYRGLLGECYVSDDQRLLLQSLYNQLDKHVLAMDSSSDKLFTDDELAILSHLDFLTTKFFPTSPSNPMNPIASIPQPAIVLCPSDFLTIFYALHPKLRPSSNQPLQVPSIRHTRKPSDESSKSDLPRLSNDYVRPILKKSNMFELHEGSASSQSEAEHVHSETESPIIEEEIDLYGLSIKAAVDEMGRRLGRERCSGEKHPCEEMWVTLYVSTDGLSVSCTPEFEGTGDRNEDEEVIVSREEDGTVESALLKLAENPTAREILRRLPPEAHVPSLQLPKSKYHEDLILLTPPAPLSNTTTRTSLSPRSSLLTAIQTASSNCFAQGDYAQAQSYQHVYNLLKSISSHLTQNDYAPVLGMIGRKIQNDGNRAITLIRNREVWFSHLLETRNHLDNSITKITDTLSQLRCKMWYTNAVRDSKAWQRAKDICEALSKMKLSKAGTTTSFAPVPNLKRNSSSLSLHRSNSMTRNEGRRFMPRQSLDGFSFSGRPASLYNVSFGMASDDWFDILTASSDQGGPHKLSDYQVDVTNRWLEEHALENFCRGEEIIHRFIAEVDDVARRLVPESADEMTVVASTFWESEEFREDAHEFGLLELGMPVARKDEVYYSGRRSEELPRTSSGVDVLGLLGRSRGKTMGGDISDSRSIRSNHSHSRATSMSINPRPLPDVMVRPTSSHSISFPPPSPSPISSFFSRQQPTPMVRSTSYVDQKAANQFLEVTRQRLLSLLLSDLGMELWCGGSETDEWFSDGLADACLERKKVNRRTFAAPAPRKGKKVPVVPGSMKPPIRKGFSLGGSDDLPTPPLSRESSDIGGAASSETADATSDSFNFATAYKRLFARFSVHPAPHEKLKALFEIERLMNASFTTISIDGNDIGTARPHFPPTPRPSIESRRTVSTSSGIGTDDLIDEIQRLLRDPETRPKTLFRDLAFISAFIPPVTLTHHGEGKVFWDIGLAASAMKTDVVSAMVDWYEEIMQGNERTTGRRGEKETRARTLSTGGMKDAARMLVIAACEGHAVGQRELALLHLSHPSLLPLTTLPLTRPSDTFHKVNLKDSPNDKDKYDPDRIALATHWFRLAAKNGDKYAKNVEGNWLGSKNI